MLIFFHELDNQCICQKRLLVIKHNKVLIHRRGERCNNRRTENTMAKRKRTTNYLQNTTQKTNDRKHEPYQDLRFELRCSERVPQLFNKCQLSIP
jgi:predicted ATPase